MVKMKSEMSAYDAKIEKVKVDILNTDVYLERFLECKILNIIHDVNGPSISNYMDRKEFLTTLSKKFKEIDQKIKEDNHADVKAQADRFPLRRKMKLDKNHYKILDIEIPETISYESEDDYDMEEDLSRADSSSSKSKQQEHKKKKSHENAQNRNVKLPYKAG